MSPCFDVETQHRNSLNCTLAPQDDDEAIEDLNDQADDEEDEDLNADPQYAEQDPRNMDEGMGANDELVDDDQVRLTKYRYIRV